MTPPLFFLQDLPDTESVELTGDEGHHAAKVRRMRVGEAVQLGDGRGGLLDCRITAVRADGLTVEVLARRQVPEHAPRVVVVQALPKSGRGELAVEVMTELGVDEIVPWSAARSVTEWSGARGAKAVERWRRTAHEASKQSRRPWVPTITNLADTAAVTARLAAEGGFVLHESADLPLADRRLRADGNLVLVVGPEGGIDERELEVFAAAGAVAVRLGAPVLRTSTAGAASLALLSVRLGRWS